VVQRLLRAAISLNLTDSINCERETRRMKWAVLSVLWQFD